MNNPPNETERRMLLEKAARCYEKEGWLEEAGRVWEEIENYGAAARNYAQGENWEKAAQCYEKGEEIMKAAWIRADKLKQKYQSLELMEKIEVRSQKEELEREIIRGRCQSSRKNRREVGKSVRKVIEYRPKAGEKHLYEWGQKLAQIIRRPDLRALLYGTAVREGIEGSIEEWEKWAKEELGDATGIPKKRRREEEEYEYETVKVNRRGEIIERETRKGRYYREKLREGIEIEMVYIEGGSFLMGSAEGEGDSDEKPQHEVTLEAFYLGKYPITQKQWQAIAELEKVEIELDPDPSNFKGENRPVERINWYEAVEFCRRLSRETGKEYRLPSEAQWEYACRAGTNSPFAYGETITGELANYRATYTYGEERAGEYKEETTPVGEYYANGWGLYDMHGNVWEWCEDEWHNNYQGAPSDGRAWKNENHSQEDENIRYILRGGSWFNDPENCRSAYRHINIRRNRYNSYGFRVMWLVGRTL